MHAYQPFWITGYASNLRPRAPAAAHSLSHRHTTEHTAQCDSQALRLEAFEPSASLTEPPLRVFGMHWNSLPFHQPEFHMSAVHLPPSNLYWISGVPRPEHSDENAECATVGINASSTAAHQLRGSCQLAALRPSLPLPGARHQVAR